MIGYAYVECLIYDVQSLKAKRSIIKQTMHQASKNLNVSIAEIDYHDLWQRTAFEIACVAKNQVIAEQILQNAVNRIDERADLEITVIQYEWL
ncbi:DUF503 domain-containing protein [Alkalibacillus almallahensis]|uniref:DUF503 domain-containing protein n=1 Tax=Alkalibacillus almallahensis TaxID=1379154 RepID=UPI0014225222|nr:DUF503 domain-containing protein [Alkalibacillus almallahensis]NIK10832.1 hypothetical protein [Alkalibacillus almallahensis]